MQPLSVVVEIQWIAVTKAESILENLKQKELECSQELAVNEAKLAKLQQQISTVLSTDSWEVDALKQELKTLDISKIEAFCGKRV